MITEIGYHDQLERVAVRATRAKSTIYLFCIHLLTLYKTDIRQNENDMENELINALRYRYAERVDVAARRLKEVTESGMGAV